MNSIDLRLWLHASHASLRISANRDFFYVTATGRDGLEETAESRDIEEAIKCAQHLFDAQLKSHAKFIDNHKVDSAMRDLGRRIMARQRAGATELTRDEVSRIIADVEREHDLVLCPPTVSG